MGLVPLSSHQADFTWERSLQSGHCPSPNRLYNVNVLHLVYVADLPSGNSKQAFSPFREDLQDKKWQIEIGSKIIGKHILKLNLPSIEQDTDQDKWEV